MALITAGLPTWKKSPYQDCVFIHRTMSQGPFLLHMFCSLRVLLELHKRKVISTLYNIVTTLLKGRGFPLKIKPSSMQIWDELNWI